MSEVTIREAKMSDVERLAELNGTLGYPVSAVVMTERLARVLPMENHTVLVAEVSGEVVGWLHGAEQEALAVGTLGEVWGLVVAAEQRGRGVGRRLMAAVEEWGRARGLAQISLRSNVIRPESHAFYERIGYTRYKTQHAYRKRLDI
ncbi:MAG TPA: GNAT family N-acetyltransferase [Chthoniobacterales bacterium]|nr:GNAT family N-acetyltransferase [Chthoniobacterales bacterium]